MPGLRGFADLHCHPVANRAFGGRVLAGAAFHPDGLNAALANCEAAGQPHAHFGHEGALLGAVIRMLSERSHGACGAPTFGDWPVFDTLYHQQMHVDWIHRSWRHGLRLLCAHMVNNEMLARESGAVRFSDFNMLESQVHELRELVAFANARVAPGDPPWMEIASSPQDARRIIGDGKLAIVIGIEMDTIESLARHVANDEPTQHQPPLAHPSSLPSVPTQSLRTRPFLESEIDRVLDVLQHFGVSMMTPVHVADNSLGGAAVYNDYFDLLNCWLRGSYFTLDEDRTLAFRLGVDPTRFELIRALILRLPARSIPAPSDPSAGHANNLGLTTVGRAFLQRAMRRGFIIDVDHMSSAATDDALSISTAAKYPFISSHSSFRALGLTRQDTTDNSCLCHEGMKTPAQVDAILAQGGLVAPITNQHILKRFGNVPNDATGTSKTYAQAFLYAVEQVTQKGGGVGLGTDFNGLAGQPGPRYGFLAPKPVGNAADALRYDDPARLSYFLKQPLPRVQLPGRQAGPFDYNVDGLAHFGLLPDFLEDLRTVGVPDSAMDTLYDSAEAFVQMWERCQVRAAQLGAVPP